MNITKPIAFFDLEGTGLDIATDRIVSISILKINPDQTQETKSSLINPGIPIPQASTDIHGITDEMVKEKPTFCQLSKGVYEFIKDCDLGGFNSNNYDIPLLCEEFARCGIIFPMEDTRFIDVGNIFKIQEPRTLEAAYKFYCNKNLEGAHDATNDVNATFEVFLAQLERYEALRGKDIDSLASFSNYDKKIVDFAGKIGLDADGDYIYNIGKSKGAKIKEDTSMAYWMLDRDFPANTKNCLNKILQELNPPENLF